jgi:hypothetical protein
MREGSPAPRGARRELSLRGKILLLLLVAYGMAVIVPDTLRPVLTPDTLAAAPAFLHRWYPLGTLGFQADNDGTVTSVDLSPACRRWITRIPDGNQAEPVSEPAAQKVVRRGPPCPAWVAGIREGDRIDLAGTELTHRRAVNGLVFVAPDRPVTLHISMGLDIDYARATGSAARDVTLMPTPEQLTGPARLWLLAAQLSAMLVFIGFCAYLVWNHPTAETWGLFLYGAWFNSGQYFVWYANLPPAALAYFDCLQVFFQALGLTGLLVFALHFPRDSVEGWRRMCQAWLVVPFLALVGAGLWGFCNYFFGWQTEAAYRLYYYITYAVYLGIAFLFWHTYHTQPDERPRIRWVILGAAWGLLCFLIADTYEATSMIEMVNRVMPVTLPPLPQSVLDFLYLQNIAFPLAVFYAVRHHRVIKVRIAITRFAALMIALGVSFIVVGYVDLRLEHYIKERMPQYLSVFTLAPVWLVLFLLRERLYDLLDRVMFRTWHQAERKLEALADYLDERGPLNLDQINGALVEEPARALDLTSAALFRRADGGAFEYELGVRWPDAILGTLRADDPLVTMLTDHEPRHLQDLDWDARPEAADIEKPALAVPIVVEGVVTRIVLFGPHTTGEDLDRDEVRVLRQLSRAAAAAYEHLISEALRHELEELRRRLGSGSASSPRRGEAPAR